MPRKPKVETARGVFEKPKGSGIWWIRYTDAEGNRRAESVGRFGDAKETYNVRKLEIKVGLVLPTGRSARGVKLATLIDDALTFSKSNHRDQKNFRIRAEIVRKAFGDRPAASLKPNDLAEWLSDMSEEWDWQPGTYNRYKAVVSKVYKLGIQNEYVTSNPARLVPQKTENVGRVRFLTAEEEVRLRDVIMRFRPHCIYQLDIALNTGMRKGEQFSVEWPQVDFKQENIYLDKTKNGSDRYVQLNETALKTLMDLKEESKLRKLGTEFLFYDRRNHPLKDPRDWFGSACKEAKIEGVTWHILRHTFASRLVMKGVDLKTLQILMGHKTISMTARYAHLSPGHLKTAVNRLVHV